MRSYSPAGSKSFVARYTGFAASQLLLIALFAGDAIGATIIGVNFDAGSFQLGPTDLAGLTGFKQTHFNNVSSGQSGASLQDDSGLPTGVVLTIPLGPGTGSNATVSSGPDEILNNGCLFGFTTPIVFTISNIPFSSYSLIVYDQAPTGKVQSISAGGITYYSRSPNPTGAGYIDNNPATPFLYTRATSTSSASPTASSNYALFEGLSGASQTVTVTGISGTGPANVGGFQIVDTSIPEPSAVAMLSTALCSIASSRRRYSPRMGCAWTSSATDGSR